MKSYKDMTRLEYHEACEAICERFRAVYVQTLVHAPDTPERIAATAAHHDELYALTVDILALADGDMQRAVAISMATMEEASYRSQTGKSRIEGRVEVEADEPDRPVIGDFVIEL